MGITKASCKIGLFIALLIAGQPAAAQVPALIPLNHTLRYDVSWNGLALGRIRIEVGQDGFGYHVTVDTKTRGVMNVFGREHTVAQVKGRIGDTERFIPQRYESRSLAKEDGRTTVITYDEHGSIATRTRTPADGASRPTVPLDQANTATDPITAFLLLREKMHANMARNQRETSLRTYEGARLADFTFKVISRARIELNGEYVNAINTVPTRTPIAGYKEKELKKHREGDPTVHVFFSADERFIPLQAKVSLMLGTITANLAEIEAIH